MNIEPSSKIYMLKNVPLDGTYEHTLYFSSKQEQYNYFSSMIKFSFDYQTYQRVNSGVVRIEKKSELCYDCNYIMFQNTDWGSDKWFYAFITKVEYVNNSLTNVYYEIDVMQTWWFDYSLKQCLVEREHVSDDTIGKHTLPEPISFTDDYYDKIQINNSEYVLETVVSYAVGLKKQVGSGESPKPLMIIGCPVSTEIYIFNDYTSLSDFVKDLEDPGSIVAFITVIPREISNLIGQEGRISKSDVTPRLTTKSIPRSILTSAPSGYTPKNKKCYVYPYNYLYATTGSQEAIYTVENNTGDFTFNYHWSFSANPSCLMVCSSYNDTHKTLQLSDYPQIPYSADITAQWNMAKEQNKLDALSSALSSSNIVEIGGSLIKSTYQGAITDEKYSHMSPSTFNTASDYSIFCARRNRVLFSRVVLKDEPLKVLDDFFSKFGYQVNRVKVPNTHNRPHWNYVKTSGCVITGSVPVDDVRKICSIYDSGITFWKNASEIGNYSLDNS